MVDITNNRIAATTRFKIPTVLYVLQYTHAMYTVDNKCLQYVQQYTE